LKNPWCIPIVALFRARALDDVYISELLFYYLTLLPPRSLPRFFLPSSPSLSRPRNKKNEEKGRGGKGGAPADLAGRGMREGGGEDVRNNARGGAFSRDYRRGRGGRGRGRRGVPLTNGSVNHGRFKVITHRQGGRRKKGGKKKGVNGRR